MAINRDALGQRGEAIFNVLMTEIDTADGPIFRPYFLGDKWPVVDFIVELLGAESATPYFFVQVKTTRAGYTRMGKRLKVQVAAQEIRALAAYPAPTYIIGVDEIRKDGFLVSANGESTTTLSSLSTRFPISKATRALLWKEVRDYWASLSAFGPVSRFTDTDWR